MPAATSPATGEGLTAPGDRRWLILVVVAIAQLMVVLDSNVSQSTHLASTHHARTLLNPWVHKFVCQLARKLRPRPGNSRAATGSGI
jgi:hypothetical protein